MAHDRERYLKEPVTKAMKMSPIVGIIGHRQVGKTTLMGRISSNYHVLDKKSEMETARNDPEKYIKDRAGQFSVVFDECQTVPELFPELKEWVRKHKRPGQFLLSGSVRFTSREAIKEALTGRISNFELLPFSVSEALGLPLPDFCPRALQTTDLTFIRQEKPSRSLYTKKLKQIESSIAKGGLPGICFIRDDKIRMQRIDDQLQTILDRDIRLVRKIQVPFSDIRDLVRALARMQGEPLDMTRLSRETGLSKPTIKKLVYALEAVFVIRLVKIEGSTMGHTFFFEDQAEWRHMSDAKPSRMQELIHFCFTDLRTQFEYRLGPAIRIFQYRTRSDAFVPVCFADSSGVLGIMPTMNPEEPQRHQGVIQSFLSAYPDSKLLLVHENGDLIKLVKSRALLIPLARIV